MTPCLDVFRQKKAMKTSFSLFALVLLTSAFSCDESRVKIDPFDLGAPFLLRPGFQYDCSECDVSVSFTKVISDSRCPSDAICVWAGMAVVELSVEIEGASHTILLATAGENNRIALGGYLFSLGEVSPYPTLQNPIAQKDYRITLTVTRL